MFLFTFNTLFKMLLLKDSLHNWASCATEPLRTSGIPILHALQSQVHLACDVLQRLALYSQLPLIWDYWNILDIIVMKCKMDIFNSIGSDEFVPSKVFVYIPKWTFACNATLPLQMYGVKIMIPVHIRVYDLT